MSKKLEKGFRLLGEGVVVSNDSYVTKINNNDLIIGGPGSGKTAGYVSNLLLNPFGSYVVSDTKGLLHRKFSKYLMKKGIDVVVIDFVDPNNSIPYNPLKHIRMKEDGKPYESDIKKLVCALSDTHREEDKFWLKMSERYISMLVAYVLEAMPEEEWTMSTVVKLHHEYGGGDAEELFKEWSKYNPDSFASRKYMDLRNSKEAEKMWVSTMEFVNEALECFDYSEYAKMFGTNETFDIASIGRKQTVVFLNTSDNDRAFSKLTNLFHTQALQSLIVEADHNPDGRLQVPVRLILDDFAASAKIDDFDNLTSILRSRDISVSILLQNLSQLEAMYSVSSARTIMNNCDHILYLSGHDPETSQFIALHLNKTAYSVLAKASDKAILISEGENARYIRKLEPIISLEEILKKSQKDDKQQEPA